MANSISLLRLPNQERLRVLRSMDARDLLLFSLISRNTKTLVKSLALAFPTYYKIHVTIAQHISISTSFGKVCVNFYKEPEENMSMFEKPLNVWISVDKGYDVMLRNSWTLEQWFQQFLYVFNFREATKISFGPGFEKFGLELLNVLFRQVRALDFCPGIVASARREVLKTFLPIIKELTLTYNPFQKGDIGFKKMLIQNLDKLYMGESWFKHFTLNELLVCNASYIDFRTSQRFVGLNRFLKLWSKGAMSRLKKLVIWHKSMTSENILKGIGIYKKYSNDDDVFCGDFFMRGYYPCRTVVDIQRFDGTKATVVDMDNLFVFYVKD